MTNKLKLELPKTKKKAKPKEKLELELPDKEKIEQFKKEFPKKRALIKKDGVLRTTKFFNSWLWKYFPELKPKPTEEQKAWKTIVYQLDTYGILIDDDIKQYDQDKMFDENNNITSEFLEFYLEHCKPDMIKYITMDMLNPEQVELVDKALKKNIKELIEIPEEEVPEKKKIPKKKKVKEKKFESPSKQITKRREKIISEVAEEFQKEEKQFYSWLESINFNFPKISIPEKLTKYNLSDYHAICWILRYMCEYLIDFGDKFLTFKDIEISDDDYEYYRKTRHLIKGEEK